MNTVESGWESLRSHNVFRKHENGYELYKRYRQVIDNKDPDSQHQDLVKLARELGTSVQVLYNRRRREYELQSKIQVSDSIRRAKKKSSKNLQAIQKAASFAEEVTDAIPIEIDVMQPLDTQSLAAIHQSTLITVGKEIQEILTGKYEKWVGGGEGRLIEIKKRDDPRFLSIFVRMVEAQRKLVEDRVTMFGMLQSLDTVESMRELEDRFMMAIEIISQKNPELLADFVKIVEGG